MYLCKQNRDICTPLDTGFEGGLLIVDVVELLTVASEGATMGIADGD